MRRRKSVDTNRITNRSQPTRKIKDLLRDFGDRERRGDSVWLILRWETLPSYLRNLRIAKEACCWVMVLSGGGSTVRCFERGESKIL